MSGPNVDWFRGKTQCHPDPTLNALAAHATDAEMGVVWTALLRATRDCSLSCRCPTCLLLYVDPTVSEVTP